jgi:predicted transposase/invertase (TIGR01784 family)
METDAFFYRLFNQLPQTLFELLSLPASRAKAYRFDSVELKKAFRIDGLFVPRKRGLPLYFVEVQFQRSPKFYANLFAKVFCYLEENDPMQAWVAVAIFPSRNEDLRRARTYEEFLQSKRVRRIYLDELALSEESSPGLGILKLISVPVDEVRDFAHKLIGNASVGQKLVELVEELLIRRFAELTREEIRTMFKLTDIRKTRVWKEAHEEGKEEGKEEGRIEVRKATIAQAIAEGMSQREIARLLKISVEEVRRLARI